MSKFAEDWIERKILDYVDRHKKQYPTYKRGGAFIEFVKSQPIKTQMYYAYHPEEIKKFSSSSRKGESLRSLVKSENSDSSVMNGCVRIMR